jgi:hypothetical protein
MGAWGTGSFENDMALDWGSEFEAEGASAIYGAFAELDDSEDYIDVDVGSMVVAACEVVAAVEGSAPPGDAPADFASLLEAHKDEVRNDSDLRAACIAALAKIAAKDGTSELADLWSEADQDIDAMLADLRRRLGANKI